MRARVVIPSTDQTKRLHSGDQRGSVAREGDSRRSCLRDRVCGRVHVSGTGTPSHAVLIVSMADVATHSPG